MDKKIDEVMYKFSNYLETAILNPYHSLNESSVLNTKKIQNIQFVDRNGKFDYP